MSQLLKAKCKKCGEFVHFDIGNLSKEEVEERLGSQTVWYCQGGNHEEQISPLHLYDFLWNELTDKDGPMTEEAFLEMLNKAYKEVYTSVEFDEKYYVDSVMSNKYLSHAREDEEKLVVFDCIQSPNGTLYYVAIL